ncbi:MAG: DUF1844 domain-containing protein [Lentisphaerae bacterium]|nr:DUF1844 domain-containing protein [Lentisphaerota bacterium]
MSESAQKEMDKALLVNLVIMLSSSAMQQLGKLVNPMTNKTEVNLEGAQLSIDMLQMIRAKTQGNLDDEEQKLLNDSLSSLQMNYVETSNAASSEEEEKPADTEEEADAPGEVTGEEGSEEPTVEGDGSNGKDPKYHKSYGDQ